MDDDRPTPQHAESGTFPAAGDGGPTGMLIAAASAAETCRELLKTGQQIAAREEYRALVRILRTLDRTAMNDDQMRVAHALRAQRGVLRRLLRDPSWDSGVHERL